MIDNFKCFQFLRIHNNWVVVYFSGDWNDDVEYKNINQNIFDGIVSNISLVVS